MAPVMRRMSSQTSFKPCQPEVRHSERGIGHSRAREIEGTKPRTPRSGVFQIVEVDFHHLPAVG